MAYIRQNSEIVKGDELWLFIGTSSTTVPIAFATQCSLNRSLATSSISSKDHGTTSYVVTGEGSWTASSEALMSMSGNATKYAFSELMEAFDAAQLVYVTFGKISNYTGNGIVDINNATNWTMGADAWEGTAYVTSLQASGSHGDTATMSIELTGIGPLKKKQPSPTPPVTGEYNLTIDENGTAKDLITLSQLSADADVRIQVMPDNAATHGNAYTYVYTTPSTSVTWSSTVWEFQMPAEDTVVTADAKVDPEISWTTATAYAYTGETLTRDSVNEFSYLGWPVTFTSSDTSVATVDSETGNITTAQSVDANAYTMITATYSGSNTYWPDSKQYRLNVTNQG